MSQHCLAQIILKNTKQCQASSTYLTKIMGHLIDPYRCTNQLLVWYVLSLTEMYQAYQHMIHEGIPMYRPSPLSDWYIPSVMSGTEQYDES